MNPISDLRPGVLRTGWRLAFLLALTSGLTGCLVIPLNRNSGSARTNLQGQSRQRFVPGQTTRAEVILALGEPDAASSDESQLAYRSEKEVAVWVLVGGGYGGGAAAGSVFKNHFWIFEFDPQGRFETAKESGRWGLLEGDRDLSLKSPRKLFGIADSSVLDSPEAIRFEFPRVYWLAGIDGYRPKGSSLLIGEPGVLFCTESNLFFVTQGQFGNAKPALELRLATVSEAHIDKYFLARRLVVRLNGGEVHSFQILKGLSQDTRAMKTACDFIRSRATPTDTSGLSFP